MTEFPLQTVNLRKSYGDRQILKDVNLEIPQGAVYGLLGPNGAGKTTTLKCLLALTRSSAGQCLIGGMDAWEPQARREVAGMIDSPAFYPNLTARENLQVISGLRGSSEAEHDELLDLVRLTEAANRPARTYSLGMKQRLGIAMTLVGHPRSLILDEPQNGLDPQGMQEMRGLLRRLQERGHTIVVSSHLLSEMQHFATHLGVMRSGELVFQGSLASFCEGAAERLMLESATPDQAQQVLLNAGLEVQREGDVLYLPATTVQTMVARTLLEAGLGWNQLSLVGGELDARYFALTGVEA